MFDKLFIQNSVIGVALDAYTVRNEIIQHNISNVDTPGFKKKIVEFEQAFSKALDSFKKTGDLNLSDASPKISVFHENYSFRLDGNNVDIDIEMAELYKNGVKYDMLTNAVINNYRKINLVTTGR